MYYIQHNGTKRYALVCQGVSKEYINWMDNPQYANSYLTFRAADKELHFYQVVNASVVYKENT
ncbi:hypothetical protein NVP1187O_204 [Vibrio phage 1.187.O._10N.286.49.F1]|nr:hypothetical protein NVP1187O_204 [Vibrio phage 1.187.O._10N.286.49.F1]